MSTHAPRTLKVWLLRILVVCASVGLALTIVEAGLWIFAPTKFHEWLDEIPDGHISFRGRPGTSFRTIDGYTISMNRLGFRGPDPSLEPAPGALRIITLGGSSTFNYEANSEEETWSGSLESALRSELKMPVEVINLALSGYDSLTCEINYIVMGRYLHPHVAVLYEAWNDLKRFRGFEEDPTRVMFQGMPIPKPMWQRVARNFQIPRLIRNVLLELTQKHRENYYTTLEQVGDRANVMPPQVAFDWNRNHYVDFARLARGDQVLPVLVTQASLVSKENLDSPEIRRRIDNSMVAMTLPVLLETWLKMNSMIEQTARDHDAVFVDVYNAVPHTPDYLLDHVHQTREGNRLVGRTIASTLLKDEEFQRLIARLRRPDPNQISYREKARD